MTDRELLQQVLDAWQDHWVNDKQSALLETIRANCAKEIYNCARCGEVNPAEIHTCTPREPEPVAWWNKDESGLSFKQLRGDWQPLYTKREWQGLTDEDKHYLNEVLNLQGRFPIIDAIEAKLKEKNT